MYKLFSFFFQTYNNKRATCQLIFFNQLKITNNYYWQYLLDNYDLDHNDQKLPKLHADVNDQNEYSLSVYSIHFSHHTINNTEVSLKPKSNIMQLTLLLQVIWCSLQNDMESLKWQRSQPFLTMFSLDLL